MHPSSISSILGLSIMWNVLVKKNYWFLFLAYLVIYPSKETSDTFVDNKGLISICTRFFWRWQRYAKDYHEYLSSVCPTEKSHCHLFV